MLPAWRGADEQGGRGAERYRLRRVLELQRAHERVDRAWTAPALAGIAAGDVVICLMSYDLGSPLPALPAGFTASQDTNVGTPDAQSFRCGYRVATGSETTFFGTANANTSLTAVFLLYRGRSASSPINAAPAMASNGSANASPVAVGVPAITMTVANCMHIVATTMDRPTGWGASQPRHTLPAGYTLCAALSISGAFADVYVVDKIIASATTVATFNIATTVPAGSGWMAASIGLAPIYKKGASCRCVNIDQTPISTCFTT